MGEKFQACNTDPVDQAKCNRETKEFAEKLKDYKGERVDLSADVLSDQTSFKLGETLDYSDIESCDYKKERGFVRGVYGAVDKVPFKKSFEFKEGQKLSQELKAAAKLIMDKEGAKLFDKASEAWYEDVKEIIKLIAEGREIEGEKREYNLAAVKLRLAAQNNMKESDVDELIYGKKGALNFLLAVSRVANVFCDMDKRDAGKVHLVIGGRGSFVEKFKVKDPYKGEVKAGEFVRIDEESLKPSTAGKTVDLGEKTEKAVNVESPVEVVDKNDEKLKVLADVMEASAKEKGVVVEREIEGESIALYLKGFPNGERKAKIDVDLNSDTITVAGVSKDLAQFADICTERDAPNCEKFVERVVNKVQESMKTEMKRVDSDGGLDLGDGEFGLTEEAKKRLAGTKYEKVDVPEGSLQIDEVKIPRMDDSEARKSTGEFEGNRGGMVPDAVKPMAAEVKKEAAAVGPVKMETVKAPEVDIDNLLGDLRLQEAQIKAFDESMRAEERRLSEIAKSDLQDTKAETARLNAQAAEDNAAAERFMAEAEASKRDAARLRGEAAEIRKETDDLKVKIERLKLDEENSRWDEAFSKGEMVDLKKQIETVKKEIDALKARAAKYREETARIEEEMKRDSEEAKRVSEEEARLKAEAERSDQAAAVDAIDGAGFGLTDAAKAAIEGNASDVKPESVDRSVEELDKKFEAYRAAENRFVTEYNKVMENISATGPGSDEIFEELWGTMENMNSSLFASFKGQYGLDAVKLQFVRNVDEGLKTRYRSVTPTFLTLQDFERNGVAMGEAVKVIDAATRQLKEFVDGRAGLFVKDSEVMDSLKGEGEVVAANGGFEVSKDGKVLVRIEREGKAFTVKSETSSMRVTSLSALNSAVKDFVSATMDSKLDLANDVQYITDFNAPSLRHSFVKFKDGSYGFVEFREGLTAEEKANLGSAPKPIRDVYKFSSRKSLGRTKVEVELFDGSGYLKEKRDVSDLRNPNEVKLVKILMARGILPKVTLADEK